MTRRILLAVAAAVGLMAVLGATLLRHDLARLDPGRLLSRAGWQLPQRVIAALAVAPGDRVADLGAGNGYFTFYLAAAVGEGGTVYAVDVDAEALAELEREAGGRGLGNVVTVLATADDPGLPDGGVDLVFICNTYHHLSDRPAYFDRLRDDLSARGRVAVVEPRHGGLSRLVSPPGHATELPELFAEMKAAHYEPASSFDFLPLQNFVLFVPERRPPVEGSLP